jgi:carboxylesterase type B
VGRSHNRLWRDGGPTELANAAIQRDLVYERVNGAVLTLDLYCPEKVSGPLPVIVWIRGGSWSRGRKERCPAVSLVRDEYAVASIDYRLTTTASGADRRLQSCSPL